jgi:hypothetical protein
MRTQFEAAWAGKPALLDHSVETHACLFRLYVPEIAKKRRIPDHREVRLNALGVMPVNLKNILEKC